MEGCRTCFLSDCTVYMFFGMVIYSSENHLPLYIIHMLECLLRYSHFFTVVAVDQFLKCSLEFSVCSFGSVYGLPLLNSTMFTF